MASERDWRLSSLCWLWLVLLRVLRVLLVLVVELAQVPEEQPEEMTTRHGSSPVIHGMS